MSWPGSALRIILKFSDLWRDTIASSAKYSDAIAALKSIRNPKPDVTAELAYTYQLDGKLDDSARALCASRECRAQGFGSATFRCTGRSRRRFRSTTRTHFSSAPRCSMPNHYRLHAIRGEIAQLQERDARRRRANIKLLWPTLPAYSSRRAALRNSAAHGSYGSSITECATTMRAQHQLKIAQTAINALSETNSSNGPFLRLRALIKMNSGRSRWRAGRYQAGACDPLSRSRRPAVGRRYPDEAWAHRRGDRGLQADSRCGSGKSFRAHLAWLCFARRGPRRGCGKVLSPPRAGRSLIVRSLSRARRSLHCPARLHPGSRRLTARGMPLRQRTR